MFWKRFLSSAALTTLLLVSPEGQTQEGAEPVLNTDEGVPVRPLVTFEPHGSFRLRGDVFGHAHLNDGVGDGQYLSAFLPPLSLNEKNGAFTPQDSVGGVNLRLRLEPVIRVDEAFAIHAQIDALDNLVLGSTPAYSPGMAPHPLAFMATGQDSPTAGVNGAWDSIRVKRAWADATLFNLLKIQAGRRPDHWGLGMLYNDGSCLDCDYGDSVDGISVEARIWEDLHLRFSWDFPAEGSIAGHADQDGGQPWDADPLDDVDRFVLDLRSEPTTREQKDAVQRRLHVDRLPVWTWGWRNAIRVQDYATDVQPIWPDSFPCASTPKDGFVDPNTGKGQDCIVLFARDAFVWTTDAWIRFDWRPAPGDRLFIEMEGAGVLLSEIGQVQWQDDESAKEFWAGGGVLRSRYESGALRVGLDLLAATGDDLPHFGTWDHSHFFLGEEEFNDFGNPLAAAVRGNEIVSAFFLHPAFTVDLLLFREVIGTVTNAMVVRPWIGGDFLRMGDSALGARLDLLYASAMFPEGTPGGERPLGFEADGQIHFRTGGFTALIEGGWLLPFHGLDRPAFDLEAEPAWTVQGRLHVKF